MFYGELETELKKREAYLRKLRLLRSSGAHSNNNNNKIDWIENLIQNIRLVDSRKLVVGIILSRYLINVRQLDYEQTYSIIWEWLDKCAALKPLEPSSKRDYDRRVVNMQIKAALKSGRLPMSLTTMQEKYPDLYKGLRNNNNEGEPQANPNGIMKKH